MLKFKVLGKKQTINIDETKDFIFKGGESCIYSYQNKVIKIYHDKNRMIPIDKIKELSVLKRDTIIKPEEILIDKDNVPVGFTMESVKNFTLPLLRLFNTVYWKKNGITSDIITRLVKYMIETTQYIHQNHCLVVDYNELNHLFDTRNYNQVFYIDINSWQTKSFPADAINPFVKDYTKKGFDELTDFYSFAILSFQMYTGIHPFSGNHPKYGIKPEDSLQRMKDNASVYDKGVKLNSAIRNFSIIPSNYDTWYKDLFIKGKRTFPPGCAGQIILIKTDKVDILDKFNIKLLNEYKNEIVDFFYIFGKEIILLENETILIDKKEYSYKQKRINVVFDTDFNAYEIKKQGIYLKVVGLNRNYELLIDIQIEDFFIIQNELYVIQNGKVSHIQFFRNNGNLIPGMKNNWEIMPKSSILFEDIIYQNIMGKCWFFLPVPKKNWGIKKAVPELDNYRIIECKRKENFLVVIGKDTNGYKKFKIKFDNSYDRYKIIGIENSQLINFIYLENGLVINVEENRMEIFDSNFEKDKINSIDCDIMNMELRNKSNQVVYFKGNKIYSIGVK